MLKESTIQVANDNQAHDKTGLHWTILTKDLYPVKPQIPTERNTYGNYGHS